MMRRLCRLVLDALFPFTDPKRRAWRTEMTVQLEASRETTRQLRERPPKARYHFIEDEMLKAKRRARHGQ